MNKFISNILKENEESIDDFFKPKNLKSREERYLKEKEKIRNIYFSFYDQMDEPEQTQAKDNFDVESEEDNSLPNSISEAINYGFQWHEAPEGSKYWSIIFDKYRNKK